jgi:hypothetical protein
MSNWGFLHRWYMPFVWLTVTSLWTVPLAIYFQHGVQTHTGAELGLGFGSSWVQRDDLLETIVPYLVNLLCIIWLFNEDGSTRWAAFWSLLLAIVRIAAPVALTATSDVSLAGNQHYLDWNTMRMVLWFQDAQMLIAGVMLWMAFGHFVGQSGSAVSHAAHAEA